MKIHDHLDPTTFVIFRGAGDLTCRKLVPVLFDRSQDRSLPTQFTIIAVDRFGASAPGPVVMREYGFSVENVCQRALALLQKKHD